MPSEATKRSLRIMADLPLIYKPVGPHYFIHTPTGIVIKAAAGRLDRPTVITPYRRKDDSGGRYVDPSLEEYKEQWYDSYASFYEPKNQNVMLIENDKSLMEVLDAMPVVLCGNCKKLAYGLSHVPTAYDLPGHAADCKHIHLDIYCGFIIRDVYGTDSPRFVVFKDRSSTLELLGKRVGVIERRLKKIRSKFGIQEQQVMDSYDKVTDDKPWEHDDMGTIQKSNELEQIHRPSQSVTTQTTPEEYADHPKEELEKRDSLPKKPCKNPCSEKSREIFRQRPDLYKEISPHFFHHESGLIVRSAEKPVVSLPLFLQEACKESLKDNVEVAPMQSSSSILVSCSPQSPSLIPPIILPSQGIMEYQQPVLSLSPHIPKLQLPLMCQEQWVTALKSQLENTFPSLVQTCNYLSAYSADEFWKSMMSCDPTHTTKLLLHSMKREIEISVSDCNNFVCIVGTGCIDVIETKNKMRVRITMTEKVTTEGRFNWDIQLGVMAKGIINESSSQQIFDSLLIPISDTKKINGFEIKQLDIPELCQFTIIQSLFLSTLIRCCTTLTGLPGHSTVYEMAWNVLGLVPIGREDALRIAAVGIIELIKAESVSIL